MTPAEIDDVTLAYPDNVAHLIPVNEPGFAEYRKNWHDRQTWGFKLFHDWFYFGIAGLRLAPKPGVDVDAALRHIRAIMRSFQPQHEVKTAACAFLLEHWFDDAIWEKLGDHKAKL